MKTAYDEGWNFALDKYKSGHVSFSLSDELKHDPDFLRGYQDCSEKITKAVIAWVDTGKPPSYPQKR